MFISFHDTLYFSVCLSRLEKRQGDQRGLEPSVPLQENDFPPRAASRVTRDVEGGTFGGDDWTSTS